MKESTTPFDILTTTGGFKEDERKVLRMLAVQYEAPPGQRTVTLEDIKKATEMIASIESTLATLMKKGLVQRKPRKTGPDHYKLDLGALLFHKLVNKNKRG